MSHSEGVDGDILLELEVEAAKDVLGQTVGQMGLGWSLERDRVELDSQGKQATVLALVLKNTGWPGGKVMGHERPFSPRKLFSSVAFQLELRL